MAKEVTIKLEDEKGKVQEYKAGKIMARTTRDAMKMYSKLEEVDKNGNPVVSEAESFDMMIDLVANSIFKKNDEVTEDTILDGLTSDEVATVLQEVIMSAMGISDEDVEEAKEGKVETFSWTKTYYQYNEMIGTLIKDYGFRWSDFDDMTDEDLHDIVNAKAEYKKKRQQNQENKQNNVSPENSLEAFLKSNGLL
ncbi:head-tail adaptor [Staphylococcus phage 6ec]|uniref:Tail assembly chaperone n=6 Tax=Sextaecvirus TaxID=1922243 RepID=A0A060AKS9_9CAUD|nr:head-tail adaptor [Staphylococcus phage 6ec]AIA64058.1 tail assembly chaperone [Staphylococcus phage 6ec]